MVQGTSNIAMVTVPPPASLVAIVRSLRLLDPRELEVALATWVDRAVARDLELFALCPEPHRRDRIVCAARALGERWPRPETRPALFAVPIGVKDLFRVDGLPTTAGSALPPEQLAGPQASAVSRLEAVGAVVLAKTTTDELAYADPPPTVNPHDSSRTPGGSSAGSAAGVAAGLFPVALGTQTSRSIIAPAAFCGVVGFKASHGRAPLDGCVALAPSLDCLGVLAVDVVTAESAAAVVLDGWRRPSPRPPVLGVPVGAYQDGLADLGWRAPFDLALEDLRAAGLDVRPIRLPWDTQLALTYRAAMAVLHGEMARTHAALVARWPDRFRARTQAGIARGLAITDAELETDRARGLELRLQLRTWMVEAGIDLLVSPSQPGPPPRLGDRTAYGDTTTPWSFAGLPCLSVPAGTIDGLPFGLQLIAQHGADEELLAWGATIDAALRRDPRPE